MEQFDRVCLSPEVAGIPCVPEMIVLLKPSDVEFPAKKKELTDMVTIAEIWGPHLIEVLHLSRL